MLDWIFGKICSKCGVRNLQVKDVTFYYFGCGRIYGPVLCENCAKKWINDKIESKIESVCDRCGSNIVEIDGMNKHQCISNEQYAINKLNDKIDELKGMIETKSCDGCDSEGCHADTE